MIADGERRRAAQLPLLGRPLSAPDDREAKRARTRGTGGVSGGEHDRVTADLERPAAHAPGECDLVQPGSRGACQRRDRNRAGASWFAAERTAVGLAAAVHEPPAGQVLDRQLHCRGLVEPEGEDRARLVPGRGDPGRRRRALPTVKTGLVSDRALIVARVAEGFGCAPLPFEPLPLPPPDGAGTETAPLVCCALP